MGFQRHRVAVPLFMSQLILTVFVFKAYSTSWVRGITLTLVGHECRMQYQLQYHMFDTILTTMNSGRGSHATSCSRHKTGPLAEKEVGLIAGWQIGQ